MNYQIHLLASAQRGPGQTGTTHRCASVRAGQGERPRGLLGDELTIFACGVHREKGTT